jgi:DNA repair exonuclease SbcCD ATPase subunit
VAKEEAGVMGFLDTLVKKLPTWRGTINYLHVAANWGRISEELEMYRQQIKDREEWAKQALTQQAQLHDLAQQRAQERNRAWQDRATRYTRVAERVIETLEQEKQSSEQWKQSSEQWRNTAQSILASYVDCTVVLGAMLATEAPRTRALLMGKLDEATRKAVEEVIVRAGEIEGQQSFPWRGTP